MAKKTITVQPYGVVVVFTDSRKEYERLTGNEPGHTEGSSGNCGTSKLTGYVIGVYDKELSTLVHECTHCSMWMLMNSGINVTDSDGEVMAYLNDYIFTEGRAIIPYDTRPKRESLKVVPA